MLVLVVRRIAQRLAHQLLHARAVAAEMAWRMVHELEQQPYRDFVARNDEPRLDFGDHRDERQQPLHWRRFVAQHARPRDEARMQRKRAPGASNETSNPARVQRQRGIQGCPEPTRCGGNEENSRFMRYSSVPVQRAAKCSWFWMRLADPIVAAIVAMLATGSQAGARRRRRPRAGCRLPQLSSKATPSFRRSTIKRAMRCCASSAGFATARCPAP